MYIKDFSSKIAEYATKSNQDKIDFLSHYWEFDIKSEPFKLIGTYEKSEKPDKNGKEYGFFVNVRNLKGDILYYPYRLGQVRIWVEHRESLINQEFWQFDVEFSKKKERNPFQLNLSNRTFGHPKNTFLDRFEKEKLIKLIFNETGYTLRDAKNTSNALKKIAGDLYTETERFIFELLQNADDIPNERKEVDVKFKLLYENLLFLHNGKPFDENDVNSIASIGDSTKRKDAEKTGYKGIGFKSVFTDAETVLINSGNFSFSFDKQSPLYEGKNIDEIPWEIKPIWTELYRYPKEVKNCDDFFKYPVAIDLEVGELKINNYKQQIQQLFSEPRFILFLRHIKTIEVQGLNRDIKIQKVPKNKRFELLDNDTPVDEWIIDDFEFSVTQETRDIMANDKIVPEKLKEIHKSKLSFACQIKGDKILKIEPDKSFLFTYLPTNVNDYKFPFLVNADFLTTANRQSIHLKNIWNLFLFEQIGYLCFKWISKISQFAELKNTLTSLIPARFIDSNELILENFNKGYDRAINEIAFLPTSKGELCKVSDAIVDLTGLSEVIGDDLFLTIVAKNKYLVDNGLENKSNLIGLAGILLFGKDELKKVFANSAFQHILTPQLLLKILLFLTEKEYIFSDIALLLSENNEKDLLSPSSLYFQTSQVDKDLLTFKAVKFLHPLIDSTADKNIEFKNWLITIGVKPFSGRSFISQHILNHSNDIDSQIKDKTNNLNFWRFVFKYELLESEVPKLSNYYVFNTNNEPIGNITNCYLSDFYKETGEPSVQQIALDLGLSDFNFISADYCINNSDKSRWRKLFYSAGLKHSQNVRIFKDKILPFIQNGKMDVNNCLKITKFVFDVFNDNRSSFEATGLGNFKVLTTNGDLQLISSCILSDDFAQDVRLDSVLPAFVIQNQINSIYLQEISNNRQNWKEFFLRLNPNVELNTAEIVKSKILIIAKNPSLLTLQNVQNIWKTIIEFKDDLLKTNKEDLKKIPLLIKNGTLALPTVCYFAKEYTPNTEIEELLSGYYDYFVSPIYSSFISYSELKIFFKQIGVEEEIRRINVGSYSFDISHKEHFSKYHFAVKFWAYFQKYQHIFTTTINTTFKSYIQNNPSVPCLDETVKTPSLVHSYNLKDLVNDNSVTCSLELNETIVTFLGIQQRLTVSKCFKVLNDIALSGDADDKRIRVVYDDLLFRFTNGSINTYSSDIQNFKLTGKLLTNINTFQNVSLLFYQDVTANYLPLDESDRIVKRFGSKDDWKKFEPVLIALGIGKIIVSDFTLDALSTKSDAVELTKTIESSLAEFAKEIDNINYQAIEIQLKSKFEHIKIYYSPNLKMSCAKLNFSPIVPNYYDTAQKTIFYSGNWNSISNAKLVEYLFKAFEISENQISKDEFVKILLENIPVSDGNTWQEMPPESLLPDGSTGRFGEELVFKELIQMFGIEHVRWMNEGGETYGTYDFEILNGNKEVIYYVDSKATTTSEVSGDTVPIYIRPSEWSFMQNAGEKYLIARVYNAKKNGAYIKYLNLRLKKLDEITI